LNDGQFLLAACSQSSDDIMPMILLSAWNKKTLTHPILMRNRLWWE
jgi:hypothetical protein